MLLVCEGGSTNRLRNIGYILKDYKTVRDCRKHTTRIYVAFFFLLGETRNGCKSPAERYISARLKENR